MLVLASCSVRTTDAHNIHRSVNVLSVCVFVPIQLSEDQKFQEEIGTILMMIPIKKLKMMLNNTAVQNIQGRRTGRIQVPEMLQPGVSPRPKYLVPGMVCVREVECVRACVFAKERNSIINTTCQ
jgi:hypothetical protein